MGDAACFAGLAFFSIGSALIAVLLLLGVGLVVWRSLMDSWFGHAWRDDWERTLNRWRSKP